MKSLGALILPAQVKQVQLAAARQPTASHDQRLQLLKDVLEAGAQAELHQHLEVLLEIAQRMGLDTAEDAAKVKKIPFPVSVPVCVSDSFASANHHPYRTAAAG